MKAKSKKAKPKLRRPTRSSDPSLTPEQALEFLESIRNTVFSIDEKTTPVSIRIPENILRAYRLKAKHEGRSYQKMMVEALRRDLSIKPA